MRLRKVGNFLKTFSLLGIIMLTCSAFTAQSQVTEPDSTEEDTGYYEEEILMDKSITEYTKLWDTSKIGVIALAGSERQTLCLHLTDDLHCCFVSPCRGKVTSNFGWRHGRIHAGIDIDLETGDPVYSAFDGLVRQAGWNRGYGYFVIISHFNGLETLYGHLSALKTEVLQPVKSGQIIGLGGNTGRSRGSHLHFEIRYFGKPVNPKLLINFEDYSLHTDTLVVGNSSTFSKSNFINELNSMVEVVNDSVYQKREEAYEANRLKSLKEKEKKKKELDKKKKEKVEKLKKQKEKERKKNASATHHTITKGDTLYSIAKKYRTTVDKLCALNGMKPTDILDLGRKIKVK
ncbi:MAG: peptidoglycan DD-metalloendopeptidase family protein [Bacteroidia bacterium]